MPYITAQEIKDRYGLDYLTLPSDHNSDNLPDISPIDIAIEDASAEIDKHIASAGFVVPLTDVDTNPAFAWVKRCTADLAIYYMAATSDTMTELIGERFKACMKQLEKIAEGKITPGGAATPTSNSAAVVSDTRRLRRSSTCWVI